jgi:predicted RNase H-like nuclease (RuvC/YqgF family)
MGAQEREAYMSTHKPKPIEECLQQIQEALEQIPQIRETLEEKPDRDDVENWSSDLAFKIEEMHDDVRDLQGEVAEVKAQVDDLYSEDR